MPLVIQLPGSASVSETVRTRSSDDLSGKRFGRLTAVGLSPAVALLLVLSGCSLPTEPPDPVDVDRAFETVRDVYRSAPEWPRPRFVWVLGSRCLDAHANLGCVDGFYSPEANTLTIAWWTGTLHTSALAHELYHWHLRQRDHDSDGGHVSRAWTIMVPNAERAIGDSR